MSDSNSHKAASPAKGRGRGRGRGRGNIGTTRTTSRKAAAAAAHAAAATSSHSSNGRGGNPAAQKTTAEAVADGSFTRSQAAEERSKELRANFIAVSNAIKPALEELAERNVNLLRDQFDAHEEVAAFKEIRRFLQIRSDDTERALKCQEQAGLTQCNQNFERQTELTGLDYQRQYDEATEDFYDAQLRRLDILEEFCRRKVPADLEDRIYKMRPVSKDRISWTKAHVEFENGVEVPCAKVIKAQHILDFELSRRDLPEHMLRPTYATKRKAETGLLEQVPPKRPASAMDGDRPTYIPRHIGGLLSATNPDDEETPSRAPSPMGSKLPSPSPESTAKSSPDRDRPYVPPASSDPDDHGVRLISKRRPVTVENYNRLMLPPLYEYEDHEIGFRDSFNDRTRYKSTRIPQFFNKPNSFAFFVDRMISSVDVGAYEPGDLSEELIEKHLLHPKYGFFLKNSRNEAEPSAPSVSGDHPVVLIDASGRIQHSSRSIYLKHLDDHVRDREVKLAFSTALRTVRQRHQLDRRMLSPEPREKEARRMELLNDRKAPTPPTSRSRSPESHVDEDVMALDEDDDLPSIDEDSIASQQWLALIDAANTVNDEESRAAAAAAAAAVIPPRRTPFDPVRDVFDSPVLSSEPPITVDTRSLDFFAQVALASAHGATVSAAEAWQSNIGDQAEAPSPFTSPRPRISQPNTFQEGGVRLSSSIERTSSQLSNRPSSRLSYPPRRPSASQSAIDPAFSQTGARRLSHSPSVPPQETYRASGDASMLDPRLFGEQDSQAQGNAGPPEPSSQKRHFLDTALNPEPEYGPPSHAPETQPMQQSNSSYHTPPAGRPYYESNYESRTRCASPANLGAPPQYVHTYVHDDRMTDQQQQHQVLQQLHGSTPFAAPLGSHLPPPPLQPIPQHHNQYAQHPPQPGHYQMQPAYHGPHQYSTASAPSQMQLQSSQYHTLQMESGPSPGDIAPRQLRSSSNGSATGTTNGAGSNNLKYRKLEPAPLPPHRQGVQSGPELRTVPFNYREGIKDYTASEPPPRHGPTQIRGWTYNNLKKPRVPKEPRASKD